VGVTRCDTITPQTGRTASGGVVLVDEARRIVWWSTDIEHRLEAAGRSFRIGASCCEVLDCARNLSGDEDARCLTSLALDRGRPLPQRPWRTDGPGGRLSGTVVARRVRAGGGTLVVLEFDFPPDLDHLLPDRTRSARGAQLEILALGPLTVGAHGRSLEGDWLRQRPGQVLRYLLAARSGPERSESIANALWPERGPGAVANVRYCIFKLREHLGEREGPGDSLILRDSGGYRLDPRRLQLDADAFTSLASSGVTAHRRGDDAAAERLLIEALALYRGDFLEEDPYADWAFTEREYLRGLAGKGLAALAQISVAGGRLVAAADHLQKLARLEPFDSRVHQMLIEVCLRRGRRTEAMRHYHAFKRRLQHTFGEQPDFELASIGSDLPAVGSHAARGLARRSTG
jgi:DNA-binding SARP family transcriptional activator